MRKNNASKWLNAWDYDCRKIYKHTAKACRDAKKISHRMERREAKKDLTNRQEYGIMNSESEGCL